LKEREYYGNSIRISPLDPFSNSRVFSEKLCTEVLVQSIMYSNKNRPQNVGKCVCENLGFQNFPGGHAPGPPIKEGLPEYYPLVMLNYPLVPKFIETP